MLRYQPSVEALQRDQEPILRLQTSEVDAPELALAQRLADLEIAEFSGHAVAALSASFEVHVAGDEDTVSTTLLCSGLTRSRLTLDPCRRAIGGRNVGGGDEPYVRAPRVTRSLTGQGHLFGSGRI